MIRQLEQDRDDLQTAAQLREQKQEVEFEEFQVKVKAETANLLRQISGLQTMMTSNDEAQTKRADRMETKFDLQCAKIDKLMAIVTATNKAKNAPATQSASPPASPQQDENDEENDKSDSDNEQLTKRSHPHATRDPARSPRSRAERAAAEAASSTA